MTKLNAAQRAAVEHGEGPLLILAGAGSGKTRVIAHRVARLVRAGTAPEAILALSFTNKAAGELAERMVPLVGRRAARALGMSTFHSFGLRFVREEKQALELGARFVILDQGDSLSVVRDILRELYRAGAARKLDAAAILARISNFKNALVAPQAVPASDFEYDRVAAEVYPEYQARLRALRAVDFDDLLALPVSLLSRSQKAHERWSERFRHVLVDEFQDTSRVQLELLKLLANRKRNVCVVGDDDQSIYGWRGADVGNILDFENHFAGTRVIKLEDNYRSQPAVLEVANAAIAQSSARRHDKRLRATRPVGPPVQLCECKDPGAEAQLVAREVGDLIREGTPRSEIAVLYRSNLQARPVEEELRAAGIPYRLFGGTQFFDRKEVKDVAAYLRVLLNPHDEISLRRILNYPPRGIGARSVEQLDQRAAALGVSLPRLLSSNAATLELPEPAGRSVQSFMALIARHRARLRAGTPLSQVGGQLVAELDLDKELREAADGRAAGAARYANVQHLLRWLERREDEAGHDRRDLTAFLERVTLRGERGPDDEAGDAVVLSTLHASKGLEFDTVFLIGCVEGQLPHSRTTDPKVSEASPGDIEEERRLFYVGVTRARQRLYLSRPQQKMLRGQVAKLTPSRFLDGLPEAQLKAYEHAGSQELDFDEIAELGRRFLSQVGRA